MVFDARGLMAFYYSVGSSLLGDLGSCGSLGVEARRILEDYLSAARDYLELGYPVSWEFFESFRDVVDKSLYVALKCRGLDPVDLLRRARMLESALAGAGVECGELLARLRTALYMSRLVELLYIEREAAEYCGDRARVLLSHAPAEPGSGFE